MQIYYEHWQGSRSPKKLPKEFMATYAEYWPGMDYMDYGQGADYSSIRLTLAFTAEGLIVGIHVFKIHRNCLCSELTWVAPNFRRKGIAKNLWTVSLASYPEQRHVEVTTVTHNCDRMFRHFKEIFPHADFDITYLGPPHWR